jgi:hypothetical protein
MTRRPMVVSGGGPRELGVPASPSGSRPSDRAADGVSPGPASIPNAVADALLAVVDAVRDYIIPDGISDEEFANRVIGATDNPEINPFIREIEHGRP